MWPASRAGRPKQLLPIGPGGTTLLEAAIARGRSVAEDRILIVTAASQLGPTREVAPNIEMIGEPVGRNTAAALGLAAATLLRRDPDAVLVVLPADQHVANEPALAQLFAAGMRAVERDDVIATIGITPTRAETGFGYVEIASPPNEDGIAPVKRFVEKPDLATAVQYVASGTYLWNAGIFLISARRVMAELGAQLPATAAAVTQIAAGEVTAEAVYPALRSISIDHAVMEHAANVVTLPANVGWDDVGSWAALPALKGRDEHDNTLEGMALSFGGTGNVVLSDGDTLIATLGVSDLVVVKSGNAILVMHKDAAQDVRKVVDALHAQGLARYL